LRSSYHRFNGVGVTIYYFAKGERIDSHSHPFEHTTAVDAGRSLVEIDGRPSFEMRPDDDDFILPANIRHRVTALEDSTVIVHMSSVSNTPDRPAGVQMVDGTIEYPQ
jgi:quercetin dioxygenase-like cupin family protein